MSSYLPHDPLNRERYEARRDAVTAALQTVSVRYAAPQKPPKFFASYEEWVAWRKSPEGFHGGDWRLSFMVNAERVTGMLRLLNNDVIQQRAEINRLEGEVAGLEFQLLEIKDS